MASAAVEKAVVLLSGGLDSTTCLALASAKGLACYALSFAYGQKHSVELKAAKSIAKQFAVKEHQIVDLSMLNFAGSALTDESIAVPDYKDDGQIPVTYVPARNTIFLSIALGWAEVLKAKSIFIGVSAVDYSGYSDCRPEYVKAFQHMANLATKIGIDGEPIKIETPLIQLNKAETIALGHSLGMDYALTVSCYQANAEGLACGRCDSCVLRKKGFSAAKMTDPTCYI